MKEENLMKINYKHHRKLFSKFKQLYPDLCTRGMSFEPYGFDGIRIYIPGKGVLIYDDSKLFNKVTWEKRTEEQEDPKAQRADKYDAFMFEITELQHKLGLTQTDIAKRSGISRKSINRYLGGIAIPKISTMNKILESLKD